MSSPASQAAALGKRNSEPRVAKRGAKAARGDLVDATSPPPFSPMSPTAALSRAFSAMPIIDTSSSSSSDPPSSPGRADPTLGPRALSVDSHHQIDSQAKSPKARAESKPRIKKPEREKRDETKERKRNGEHSMTKTTPMSISSSSSSSAAAAAAAVPLPAPISVTSEREKKKLNLPRVPAPPPTTPQFRCPYCSRDFDEQQLIQHVLSDHPDGNPRVVCPMCARAPGGDVSLRSRNFQGHLQARHGGVLVQQKKAPRKYVVPPSDSPLIGRGGGGVFGDDDEGGEWVSFTPHLQHLRDRSLESLWDYVLSFDSSSRQSRCEACRGKLAPTEATCLLHCGHTYHSGCISESDPDPQCPVCLSTTGDVMHD